MSTNDASPPDRARSLSFGLLDDIVGFHLARASVTAYDAYERFIGQPFGLKKVEFSLLLLVMANGAISPKRLARGLAVTAPKLTLLLDRLQERDLIRREKNPADGRSQHVVFTPEGRKIAEAAAAAAQPMERELQKRLTRAEHAILIELLDKLAGHTPD
jgi:DNA-binding MarR family transcriptional regulator